MADSRHAWRFPCELHSNYDGDTFNIKIDLGFALVHHVSIRLHGVDTPEIRGGSDLTKALARYARDYARRMVESGNAVFVSKVWSGKFGRPIGDIEVDGTSLADWLIRMRLGVDYEGGSRAALQEQHELNAEHHRDRGNLAAYL